MFVVSADVAWLPALLFVGLPPAAPVVIDIADVAAIPEVSLPLSAAALPALLLFGPSMLPLPLVPLVPPVLELTVLAVLDAVDGAVPTLAALPFLLASELERLALLPAFELVAVLWLAVESVEAPYGASGISLLQQHSKTEPRMLNKWVE